MRCQCFPSSFMVNYQILLSSSSCQQFPEKIHQSLLNKTRQKHFPAGSLCGNERRSRISISADERMAVVWSGDKVDILTPLARWSWLVMFAKWGGGGRRMEGFPLNGGKFLLTFQRFKSGPALVTTRSIEGADPRISWKIEIKSEINIKFHLSSFGDEDKKLWECPFHKSCKREITFIY